VIIDETESSDSLSESSEGLFEVREICHSISIDSLHSCVDASSKTNLLLAPSVSATSILERSQFAEHAKEIIEKVKKYAVEEKCSEIGFNREELVHRLQNLVAKSLKKFKKEVIYKIDFAIFSVQFSNTQMSLPGDKTKKFALRYRDEFEA
jgi:hypothetical protein